MKRGRISRDEDKRIAEYISDGFIAEDIAIWLNRPKTQIENHIRKFYGKGNNLPRKAGEVAEFLRELRSSSHWKFLKEQYDGAELEYYEELYASVMSQFKDDILPTEQLQILQALDAVIMINRHKRGRKLVEDQLRDMESRIEELKPSMSYDDAAKAEVLTLESQRQGLISQSNARTKDFTDLSKKFDETIAKLKGTREQRIKNIESSRQSWTGLIKSMQDRKVREREGRKMEMIRLATNKAASDLQKPYKYINGELDQPLLAPENVLIEFDVTRPDENAETDQETSNND